MSDIKKRADSDRALARLLAEALQPSDGASNDEACPDAGLLAAYAEHNLDTIETARWEEHFAGCARCQKILAVLTVSGEEPLSEAEVAGFGQLVATVDRNAAIGKQRPAEAKKVAIFAPPRTASRWLAPAVGIIAAAVALWIALRPAPPRGTSAITAQKTIAQPSPAPGESLEAKADVPPPPAAASREAVPGQAGPQPLQSLAPTQPQKKESEQTANVAQVQQQSTDQADSVAPSPEASDLQKAAAPAPPENSPEAKVTEEPPPTASTVAPPAPALAAPRAAAPIAQATAPAAAGGAEAKPAENRPVQTFAARGIAGGLGLASRAPVVVASPGRSVLWRLDPAGRIERSADQGRSWQEQASGVTGDLLAGAAPSDTVAWIAGRAGVILRTTDGQHWQRVTSPDAATDWTSISASDALHATITSSDRRRFATEDGGQTWKLQ